MNILKNHKDILLYILIVLTITLPWFFNRGYLLFIDFSFGPSVSLNFLSSDALTTLIIKTLSLFYFYDFGEKLFISLIFLTVFIGGKKVVENFSDDKTIIFLSSLFFLFNPFIYDRIMYGQIGIVLAFGFFCIGLGYLLKVLKSTSLKNTFLSGLFFGLSIQLSIHFAVFFAIFLIALTFLLILRKCGTKKIFILLLIIFTIVFLINLNHIISIVSYPSIISFLKEGIQSKDLEAFKTSGEGESNLAFNVLMMSGFWGKDQMRYLDLSTQEENWGRSFLFLSPLIIIGFVLALKNRGLRPISLILIIIFFLSVVLAMGIKSSFFGQITYWLFDKFVFYRGFRETQKWVSLIVIIYGIFLTIGLNWLFGKKNIKNNKLIVATFIAGVIIMQAPFLLFGLRGQIKPVNFPSDWYEAESLILKDQEIKDQKCSGKILILPWHMYMSFKWTKRVIFNPSKHFFSCPTIQGTNMEWGGIYDNSQNKDSQKVVEWINGSHSIKEIGREGLNIEYVILLKELDWQKYQWLDSVDYLTLQKELETIKVYKLIEND